MTLSRWRRVVTGVAAGVIVLCAALIGASFSDDSSGVSVASELRPANIIPIEEDPIDTSGDDESADSLDTDDEAAPAVTVIDTDDLPATDTDSTDTGGADSDSTDTAGADSDNADSDSATTDADSSTPDESAGTDNSGTSADDEADNDATGDEAAAADDTGAPIEPTTGDTATPEEAPAPLTSTDGALGTGGGVDDAECALDRLVIYAGARVGGVAGSIRSALSQAGFGASCATPVTVLASNCPLQFAGVLGAGSGYDPAKSFVASSATVDRDTMATVMGSVGYTGNQIDVLDFSFVNPDRPGEQWIAIFVPPSFDGWQALAGRAGLSPSTQSLCAPSGELAG